MLKSYNYTAFVSERGERLNAPPKETSGSSLEEKTQDRFRLRIFLSNLGIWILVLEEETNTRLGPDFYVVPFPMRESVFITVGMRAQRLKDIL